MATTPPQPPVSPATAMQRAAANVQQAQKDRLTSSVNSLAAILDHAEIPRLPESHFKNFFLPYFTGAQDANDGKNAFAQWISVASTPTSEVAIIDDASGAELFRVPPLLDPSIINPVREIRKGSMAFADIVKLSMSYGSQLPIRGERVLHDGLVRKQQELRTTSQSHSAYEQRWVDIFRRYNAIRADILPEAAAKQDGALSDDEMEF